MSSTQIVSQEQQGLVDRFFDDSADYWNRVYADTDVTSMIYQYRRDVTLQWIRGLGLPPSALVADIGCGTGATAVLLAQAGFEVHAVDRVVSMLELTNRNALNAGVSGRIKTLAGDVHALDIPSNTYNVVVALGVLPWLHSPELGLSEMVRIARRGGLVILSADNAWRIANILDPAHHPWMSPFRRVLGNLLRCVTPRGCSNDTNLARMQSLAEVDGMLAKARLCKLRSMTLGFGPLSLLGRELLPDQLGVRLNRVLQNYADRGVWPLYLAGAHYIVLAQKQP